MHSTCQLKHFIKHWQLYYRQLCCSEWPVASCYLVQENPDNSLHIHMFLPRLWVAVWIRGSVRWASIQPCRACWARPPWTGQDPGEERKRYNYCKADSYQIHTSVNISELYHVMMNLMSAFRITLCDDESDEGLSELHYVMMNLMRAFQNYIMWWWISWWPFRIMLCDDESHASLSELQLCDDESHESLSELHYVMMNLMGAFQNYNYVMMNLMRAYPNKTCHGSRAANLWKLTSVTICNNFKIFSNISQNFSIFTQ